MIETVRSPNGTSFLRRVFVAIGLALANSGDAGAQTPGTAASLLVPKADAPTLDPAASAAAWARAASVTLPWDASNQRKKSSGAAACI